MKLGLNLPTFRDALGPGELLSLARLAEEIGYHQLWVGEHVVLSDDEPNAFFESTAPMPEPLSLLSAIAAVTERIRLGTGVCLAVQRNPVYLAKEASTVDWLSAGRLDLGMGIGWSPAEMESVGLVPGERPARFRDWVEVMRHLWTDANTAREWSTYRLPAVRQFPLPPQAGGPPLWVGGNTDPALRRTAELGDGWLGFADIDQDLEQRIGYLQERAAEYGRPPVRVALLTYQPLKSEVLSEYDRLGVEQLVVSPVGMDYDEVAEQVRTYATDFDALRETAA
ncbi:TIGR03619 family F420-dependent LLM class oxidoreductase [Nocardioides sp. GXZ039]|uniref:TIGR03619 family F420-dependent LLM class oxidoreductase n=1 Tax=Nocardioides sp. GXZ039 TaxID=3136018 RepID=UPI0030F3A6D3